MVRPLWGPLLLSLAALAAAGETSLFDFEETGPVVRGVTHLHSHSFRPFVRDHTHALVLFGNHVLLDASTALNELYGVAIDEQLREDRHLNIGFLDCSKDQEICEAEHAMAIPVLVMYVGGRPHEFHGRMHRASIQRFIDDLVFRKATLITKPSKLEAAMNRKRAFMFYFRPDTPQETVDRQLEVVNEVAHRHLELKFFFSNLTESPATHGEVDPRSRFTFVLHRKFGDGNATLSANDTLSAAQLEDFVKRTKSPDVVELHYKIYQRVFRGREPAAFLVYVDRTDLAVQDFEALAPEFKDHLHFIRVSATDPDTFRIRNFLGAFGTTRSMVVIFDKRNVPVKHRLDTWDRTSLHQFFQGFVAGTLPPYYKSAESPLDNDDRIIKSVTGTTFDELVLASPDNVLLIAYLGQDVVNARTYIQFFMDYMERLEHAVGVHFQPMVFDASDNEHPALEHLTHFPVLLLFKAGEKDRPHRLPRSMTFRHVLGFLEKHFGRLRYTGPDKEIPLDGSL